MMMYIPMHEEEMRLLREARQKVYRAAMREYVMIFALGMAAGMLLLLAIIA